MADGRERAEWMRACWLMEWTGRFTGGKFQPNRLYDAVFPPVGTGGNRVVSKEESDLAFAAIRAGLKAVADGQRRG